MILHSECEDATSGKGVTSSIASFGSYKPRSLLPFGSPIELVPTLTEKIF